MINGYLPQTSSLYIAPRIYAGSSNTPAVFNPRFPIPPQQPAFPVVKPLPQNTSLKNLIQNYPIISAGAALICGTAIGSLSHRFSILTRLAGIFKKETKSIPMSTQPTSTAHVRPVQDGKAAPQPANPTRITSTQDAKAAPQSANPTRITSTQDAKAAPQPANPTHITSTQDAKAAPQPVSTANIKSIEEMHIFFRARYPNRALYDATITQHYRNQPEINCILTGKKRILEIDLAKFRDLKRHGIQFFDKLYRTTPREMMFRHPAFTS